MSDGLKTRWIGWEVGYFYLVVVLITILIPFRVNTQGLLPLAMALWVTFIAARPVTTYTPQRPIEHLKLAGVMTAASVVLIACVYGFYALVGLFP